MDFLLSGEILYDGKVLAVNSAQIFDFGSNNFSDKHYEYFLTLSDGVYNGGNEYIGGTYSITIELLSLGTTFEYGDFQSCFFCGNTTTYSYVGHLFLIEDLNDDDQLDFNTDPFSDGDTGIVKINKNNDLTNLEIDFVMADGKELKGCYSGVFPIDPMISVSTEDVSTSQSSSIKIQRNPVQDILRFEIETQETEPYHFYLHGGNGQLIISGFDQASYQEIDISQLSTGIYYLDVVLKNKKTKPHKIIVL